MTSFAQTRLGSSDDRKASSKQKKDAGGALPYPTLPLPEIEAQLWRATNLCKDDAVLFLWAIDKYLVEAQQMAERLGWKLHARFIWNKLNGPTPAFTIRFSHEYLLYMWRGKMPRVAEHEQGKITDVFEERAKRHSQKPEIAFEVMERLYPEATKLEMYARSEREGWDCWGNEV